MVEMKSFGVGPGFVPPKNLQYFLLILKEIKTMKGRTKLFKIHSLIEEEGHVKYNLPIDTYPLGPADYETFNFCKDNHLIEDELVHASPYDYYETSLTRRGRIFFEKFCEPNMENSEVKKALKVISKYKAVSGMLILEHVHKKYVDPFEDPKNVHNFISEAISRISIISNIVQKTIRDDNNDQEILLGELRHLAEVLKSLKEIRDQTKIGTILVNLNSFFECLKINNYNRGVLSIELFEFLDHYADKEDIQKSITSLDFSDIPSEERERLFQKILEMKIPPSS